MIEAHLYPGPDGIVLMGHGSRDPAGVREFLALAEALAGVAPLPVEPGLLERYPATRELDPPSIQDAVDRCVARGARRIAAVPAVLFAGGHGTQDLPDAVEQARQRHPGVDLRLADLIGIDDALLDRLVERADDALADAVPVPAHQTSLLLVTSGSARREANADVFKAARLLADRAAGRTVEVAFLRLSRPYLQDAVRRCARLGARRVVVLPLLVNTGLLARRIPRKLVWLRRELPDLELIEVPHLGVDPVLVALLARRAVEAFDNQPPATSRWRPTPVRLAAGQERCRPVWQPSVRRVPTPIGASA